MVEVGDIYECLLEEGSDGRRFGHRLVYIEEGKYDFHVYDNENFTLTTGKDEVVIYRAIAPSNFTIKQT